jgi:hypothetical protein
MPQQNVLREMLCLQLARLVKLLLMLTVMRAAQRQAEC